ncbi:hypothetical protein BH20ACI2_BH20ACI2_18540 [soil metagenome]
MQKMPNATGTFGIYAKQRVPPYFFTSKRSASEMMQ